jgi:signal transduction histidine kinase/DNA-binding response OmpR family regulator
MARDDKVNILVVDDLREKLLAIELILEELGENVVCVRSGKEALRQLLEQDFAVILLDVNMPDMDGFETAALVRQRRRSQHTPIIFVTALSDEMHATQGYSLGAVDFILSPLIPEVLRTKVRVFVDLFRMAQQIQRQAEERIALEREQAARVVAEETTRRSRFLSEASKVLHRSLDFDAILQGLADLVVPFLADLCAVTAVGDSAVHWKTVWAWTVSEHGPRQACQASGPVDDTRLAEAIERALRSAKLEQLERPAVETPTYSEGRPTFGDARSALVLPLQARGRILGTLALAMSHSGREYSTADLALAEDFASRAAIAMDNARLYASIREADQRKNEFLAMLAHELRNPLAPIRNAIQVFRLHNVALPQLQFARDVVDRQVQLLVRLVDDLLDVSRITRGKVTLQKEVVDIASVVARAVETSQPLIEGKNQLLSVELPPEPLEVDADPARLAQVLSNLLNNASKYTETGGRIWLNVSLEAPDNETSRQGDEEPETADSLAPLPPCPLIRISVRDTGVGIPPEMLTTVFDLFTQIDRSLDRSQGGLGIGLTLVRQLVEMHGGAVEARSRGLNQGSEFVVHLPALVRTHAVATSTNGVSKPNADALQRRILVVDDNVDGADSLALLLRVTGHEVSIAHDGPSALEVARTFHPEIVLLDIGLPGMNGYEVARQMRQDPELQPAYLIALTGYGQDADRLRSRDAGFDHHLVKPVGPEVLPELFASLGSPVSACTR